MGGQWATKVQKFRELLAVAEIAATPRAPNISKMMCRISGRGQVMTSHMRDKTQTDGTRESVCEVRNAESPGGRDGPRPPNVPRIGSGEPARAWSLAWDTIARGSMLVMPRLPQVPWTMIHVLTGGSSAQAATHTCVPCVRRTSFASTRHGPGAAVGSKPVLGRLVACEADLPEWSIWLAGVRGAAPARSIA